MKTLGPRVSDLTVLSGHMGTVPDENAWSTDLRLDDPSVLESSARFVQRRCWNHRLISPEQEAEEMQSLVISAMPISSLHNHTNYIKKPISLQTPQPLVFPNRKTFSGIAPAASASPGFNCSRVSINYAGTMKKTRGFGTVCYAATGALAASNLQIISTVASVILMLARGTMVQKSFIVPLFALQAPTSVISWIKGEYGIWSAFLALLVRLFFFIPGELELPFIALLLVIVAPYQVMNLRGRQEGTIISLVIAAYLAFQHFSRAGSLENSFNQGSVVATIAIICIIAVSCLLLI